MIESFVFSLFICFFLFLQILILKNFDFDSQFLKVGKELSKKQLVIVIFLFFLFVIGIIYLYFKSNGVDRMLYLNSFLFLFGIFLTLFLSFKIKNILLKFLIFITISALLLSITLIYQQVFLKNIITAGAFLWVSPLFFKYIKDKRFFIFIFMIFFMFFDIYNVFILNPIISTTYNHVFLNAYVEIGHLALGVGDFFLSYFALGLIVSDGGIKKSYVLAILVSVLLFIISILNFKYDIPFSIFIVIPTMILYSIKNNL